MSRVRRRPAVTTGGPDGLGGTKYVIAADLHSGPDWQEETAAEVAARPAGGRRIRKHPVTGRLHVTYYCYNRHSVGTVIIAPGALEGRYASLGELALDLWWSYQCYACGQCARGRGPKQASNRPRNETREATGRALGDRRWAQGMQTRFGTGWLNRDRRKNLSEAEHEERVRRRAALEISNYHERWARMRSGPIRKRACGRPGWGIHCDDLGLWAVRDAVIANIAARDAGQPLPHPFVGIPESLSRKRD